MSFLMQSSYLLEIIGVVVSALSIPVGITEEKNIVLLFTCPCIHFHYSPQIIYKSVHFSERLFTRHFSYSDSNCFFGYFSPSPKSTIPTVNDGQCEWMEYWGRNIVCYVLDGVPSVRPLDCDGRPLFNWVNKRRWDGCSFAAAG
jgi:hypothetical protein